MNNTSVNSAPPLFSSLIIPKTYIKTFYDHTFLMQFHSHKNLELLYCVSGKISIEEPQGKVTPLIPRQFVIILHEGFHRIIPHTDDVEILVLELACSDPNETLDHFLATSSMFAHYPALSKIMQEPAVVLRFSDTNNVYDILLNLVNLLNEHRYNSEFFEPEYEISIRQLFLALCRIYANYLNVSYDRYFNRAMEFIGLHFSEDVTTEDIASYMGVTPSYAQKLCRTATGMTIMKIVNFYRLKQAEYLISFTKISIAEIAKKSGFCTPSNLYKHFFAEHSCSPSVYRNRLNEKSFYVFDSSDLAKNLCKTINTLLPLKETLHK